MEYSRLHAVVVICIYARPLGDAHEHVVVEL